MKKKSIAIITIIAGVLLLFAGASMNQPSIEITGNQKPNATSSQTEVTDTSLAIPHENPDVVQENPDGEPTFPSPVDSTASSHGTTDLEDGTTSHSTLSARKLVTAEKALPFGKIIAPRGTTSAESTTASNGGFSNGDVNGSDNDSSTGNSDGSDNDSSTGNPDGSDNDSSTGNLTGSDNDSSTGNPNGSDNDSSTEPTTAPTSKPTTEPTPVPTPEPTPVPTSEPTPVPTPEPTPVPTSEPTPVPTPEPTPVPTPEPTPVPTPEPTPVPTPEPTPVPTPVPTPEPQPPAGNGNPNYSVAMANEVLALINSYRTTPLTNDPTLVSIADTRALEITVNFAHAGGYSECLAKGQGSAPAVVDAWMNSPVHKSILLDELFVRAGVSCYNHNGTLHWVIILEW